MNSKIQVFENEQFGSLRIVDRDGEPWFVAKDVATALGYVKTRNAITAHCKGGRKMRLPSNGGNQDITVIPESDVYRLVLRSKLPQAEAFQDWVVEEVLPSIRKHGVYVTNNVLDAMLTDPRHMADLLTALADERDRRIDAEDKLKYLKPNAPFGTPSKYNGIPREALVKPYWRSVKTTTITEIITWQHQLFDFQ